jgi:regulator of replication initiation timing
MSSHEINDLLDENTELRQENTRLREALGSILETEDYNSHDRWVAYNTSSFLRSIAREALGRGE